MTRARWALGWFLAWGLVCALWWGLAFAGTASASPAWLKQMQSLCFSVGPDGMPDAGGWLTLFGGPLMLLAAFVLAFYSEFKSGVLSLKDGGAFTWTAAILAAVLLFELGWAGQKVKRAREAAAFDFGSSETQAMPAAYPRLSEKMPAFKLVDEQGKERSAADFKGKITVLGFVFSHCKTVCPFLVREALDAQKLAPQLSVLFVTLDPWRDTPAALPSMMAMYGLPGKGSLLSGRPDAVQAFLKALGLKAGRDAQNGEISHAPEMLLVGPDGRIAYRFLNPPASWLAEAARRLGGA